ncbi:MFS transporter [Lacinutrix salivirga]
MIIPNSITHSKSSLMYALAYCFERASYYGMRAIIVLLMVDSVFNFSREKALTIYGWFAMGVIFSKLLGAVLGDLLIKNKNAAILGGIMQATGCFILCIQTPWCLYLGIGLITLSTGLFSSNTLALFGNQYLKKPKLLDAGFTSLFVAINIGSFFGIVVSGYLGNINFNYGFIAAGIFVLIGTLFVFLANENQEDLIYNIKSVNLGKNVIYILAALVISGVFWVIYQNSYYNIFSIQEKIFNNVDSFIPESVLKSGLNSYIGMIVLIILAILWTRIYTNSFFKLFIGLASSALSFVVLLFIPENPETTSIALFLCSMFFLSLGEMLISPMLFSITTRFSNPKYLAIMLSFVTIPSLLFNRIADSIREYSEDFDNEIFFSLSAIILFFIGVLTLLFWKLFKTEDRTYLTEEAKEFLS